MLQRLHCSDLRCADRRRRKGSGLDHDGDQGAALGFACRQQFPERADARHRPKQGRHHHGRAAGDLPLRSRIDLKSKFLDQAETRVYAARQHECLGPRCAATSLHPGDTHTLKGDAQWNMTTKPKRHVGFKFRGQSGLGEHVDRSLLAEQGLLPACADCRLELSILGQRCLYEGHAKGAAACADRVLKTLRLEGVEHELDAVGGTALKGREYGLDLVGQQRDDDQIIRGLLIEEATDPDAGPLAFRIDDRFVSFELLQANGAGPSDDGDFVTANIRKLKGEGAADFPSAEDRDPKRRRRRGRDGFWHSG